MLVCCVCVVPCCDVFVVNFDACVCFVYVVFGVVGVVLCCVVVSLCYVVVLCCLF